MCLSVQAQKFLQFKLSATEQLDSTTKRLKNVEVKCYNLKNELVKKVFTKSNGKVVLDSIPINQNYKIEFSKFGYISKMITVNMEDFQNDEDYYSNIIDLVLSLSLFKGSEDQFSFLNNEPVVEFYFDAYSHSLDFKKAKLKKMKKKIDYARCGCNMSKYDSFLKAETEVDKKSICPEYFK